MNPSGVWLGSLLVATALGLGPAAVGRAEESAPPAEDLAELTLEQLVEIPVETVFGASRYEQKVTRAPSSVSIVTSEDIRRFGYRTLAEILGGVRGLYPTDDRNYAYLGIRGFNRPGDYNTRMLLLLDGHRLNDNVYDSALIGTEAFLDVDLIDRVEVIRGPSSSIYGSNAFLGVVNVVTKAGRHFGGLQASGEYGSHDAAKGRLTYGRRLDSGVELLISGSVFHSDGDRRLRFKEFDDPPGAGIARDSDDDQSYNLFGRLAWKDLTLSGGYATRDKTIPTASFETLFNDGRERTTDSTAFGELRLRHAFATQTELNAAVAYHRYYYGGAYPYDYEGTGQRADVVLNRDRTIGDTVGLDLTVAQRLLDRHTLLAGGEWRENLRQFQTNFDPGGPVYFRDDRSSRHYGLFLQGELDLPQGWLLNAGVRYDHYATFGGSTNPRVGLLYQPWPSGTVKLLYGQAFRAPNAYELYYQALTSRPNPDLRPERIRTYEAGYEQYLAGRVRLAASLYRYEIDDLISQTTDPASGLLAFANVDQVEAHGLEVEGEARLPLGIRTVVSYAWQRAVDGAGHELTNSPRHLVKARLLVPLYADKLFAGTEIRYGSAVKTLAGRRARDFVLTNLTLSAQRLARGLELSASIYNLFDVRYGFPGAADHVQDVIIQDGRGFRLKLTYTF